MFEWVNFSWFEMAFSMLRLLIASMGAPNITARLASLYASGPIRNYRVEIVMQTLEEKGMPTLD